MGPPPHLRSPTSLVVRAQSPLHRLPRHLDLSRPPLQYPPRLAQPANLVPPRRSNHARLPSTLLEHLFRSPESRLPAQLLLLLRCGLVCGTGPVVRAAVAQRDNGPSPPDPSRRSAGTDRVAPLPPTAADDHHPRHPRLRDDPRIGRMSARHSILIVLTIAIRPSPIPLLARRAVRIIAAVEIIRQFILGPTSLLMWLLVLVLQRRDSGSSRRPKSSTVRPLEEGDRSGKVFEVVRGG